MTAERAPAIKSADYIYDHVQRIEVFLEVPPHSATTDSAGFYRIQARTEAFRELLNSVDVDRVLTVEYIARNKQEETADGVLRELVGCELRYTTKRF